MQNGNHEEEHREQRRPSLEDAVRALDSIDACLLGLLPTGGAAVSWPTPEQATQRAEALVDASATISRALRAFGAAGAGGDPASGGGAGGAAEARLLRRAVAGLEAEVRNADALLERSRASVARWRAGTEAAKGAIDRSLALPEDAAAG